MKHVAIAALWVTAVGVSSQEMRELPLEVLEDKIRGGLAGQMIGVAFGGPTEFNFLGEMVSGEIKWTPEQVRDSLIQDDLYVDMTFAEVMDRIGLDATTEQYGEAFKDSKYKLWHANASARRHLNNGIKAPMTGHPKYNIHANDIDFQIEADFIGLMTPGLPQQTIEFCNRVGRVMNYGDGVYGGMFVCGMYSAAFFETDVRKIVAAGVACMPEGSGYREIIEDVVATHAAHPDEWKECWRLINERWDKNDSCTDGALRPFNIDARLNGAYIAIGMLYGDGDFAKTLEITTRCGQDSDCNPASAAGVLGVVYGYEKLDPDWRGGIPAMADEKFVFTDYSFDEFNASTMKRVKDVVTRAGGRVETDRIVVPVQTPKPPALEQWTMGIPKQLVHSGDAAWKYTGEWESRPEESRWTPAHKVSYKGGNEAELKFTGSAVAIMGRLTQDGGRATVYLDGKEVGEINAYIVKDTSDDNLWHAYGLEDGPHTLRIVTLEEKDPRSSGKRIAIFRGIVFGPE